jgi:hypothetical protein
MSGEKSLKFKVKSSKNEDYSGKGSCKFPAIISQ